jgi:hypothetical protein
VDVRAQVVSAVSSLSLTSGGVWLPQVNPYLTGGSKKVVEDCKASSGSFSDVAAYIGASAFVHCADAWSYVGRAADALLKGDLHASVHLAYYAELRGAKSLLAAEGIFVGNNYSCALDAGATLTKVNGNGTHLAAWELIADWFQQAGSIAAIAKVIAPGGQQLQAWVSAIPGGVGAVVQDMLAGIAFDLHSFAEDRERRNLASYEPATLLPSTLDVETIRTTVAGLWSDIEPMSRGEFPGIDRAVLANLLFRQYSAQNAAQDPVDPMQSLTDWSGWESWVDSLTPASLNPSALRDALRSDPLGTSFQKILGSAFVETSGMTDPAEFIRPMLGRATVLTRLATGMCTRMLADAGKAVDDLTAWTERFAISRGYIETAPLPAPATDLFADMDFAREILEQSRATTLNALLRDLADGVGLLGQTDRVVAWSFG